MKKKGGFWQPITGGVEVGENFEEAAKRELGEELGIFDYLRIFDTGYSFEFFDDNRQQFEKVYAVEINPETTIKLSEEHTDFKWATKEDCLNNYLKYQGNKTALITLSKTLED